MGEEEKNNMNSLRLGVNVLWAGVVIEEDGGGREGVEGRRRRDHCGYVLL